MQRVIKNTDFSEKVLSEVVDEMLEEGYGKAEILAHVNMIDLEYGFNNRFIVKDDYFANPLKKTNSGVDLAPKNNLLERLHSPPRQKGQNDENNHFLFSPKNKVNIEW